MKIIINLIEKYLKKKMTDRSKTCKCQSNTTFSTLLTRNIYFSQKPFHFSFIQIECNIISRDLQPSVQTRLHLRAYPAELKLFCRQQVLTRHCGRVALTSKILCDTIYSYSSIAFTLSQAKIITLIKYAMYKILLQFSIIVIVKLDRCTIGSVGFLTP